ncbi:hypothetical protein BP5796_02909 [Coleophoma crateriformis]|uniref:Uncharacterized protein n=1 Tax=Coleophoma crateriformis TaxID=565419 RepID=A0A3D8SLK6_9HELO|nr:hypothetical protein BP5796_02909 [Coleophoma crateriformis]
MPLHTLMKWGPFRLDALGLVTLIGAEEVNQAVGSLVGSKYTVFLPLLGQYFITGNQFTESISGFTLYNLTDAITTTTIAGWFSRWLRSQDLKTSTTAFEWTVLSKDKQRREGKGLSLTLGSVIAGILLVLTTLIGDWWGISNSIALVVSVFVRWYLVQENNYGLDKSCEEACYRSNTPQMTYRVKVLVTLDDGKMVTIYAPRGLVIGGFLRKPKPVNRKYYTWTRRLGWFFFGIHAIALGQCSLVTQLVTVAILVSSTWLVVRRYGCNEFNIGSSISIQQIPRMSEEVDRRLWAYAKLQPTPDEEESLLDWNLLPRKVNKSWWTEYEHTKQSLRRPFQEKIYVSSCSSVRSDSELS